MDQLIDAARRAKALEAVVSECNCTYVQETEAEAKKRLGEVAAVMQHREELARKAGRASTYLALPALPKSSMRCMDFSL